MTELMTTASSSDASRRDWSALPRRRPVRPTPALLKIRMPVSRRTWWVLAVLSVLIPFGGWWLLSVSGVVQPANYLPTPPQVWQAGLQMAESGELLTDAWATLQRVLVGFAAAIAVSVPVGIAMGSFSSAQAL